MSQATNSLPINVEIVHKLAHLPVKLAELAEVNPSAALDLLTAWGKGTKPITHLWADTLQQLDAC